MTAGSILDRSRKGVLALTAAAAATAFVADSADAAQKVKGTVVALDAARGTVVVAGSRGAAKTLRTSGTKRYRVGHRVAATGAEARADGTYAARRVKRAGVAKRARLRATVVRRTASGYLVSAGSSTFAIRRRATAAASAASQSAPQAGDVVVLDLALGSGAPTSTGIETVGECDLLEIEGIFLDVTGDTLSVAVAKRGLVRVSVPEGWDIAAAAGDEVELIVSVAGGVFTLVALENEDGDHEDGDHEDGLEIDDEDGEVEVDGTITALSAESVTVEAGPNASVTCLVPADAGLTGFAEGDEVEMECEIGAGGTLQLEELESATAEFEVENDDSDDDDDADDDDDRGEDRHGDDRHGDDDSDDDD
jgi:hypothetical protein